MTKWRLSPAADRRLDEIYVYTREHWGERQAEQYLRGLFACFDDIAGRRITWRIIPAAFDVDGFYCRHERHFIYWREFDDGMVGIVTILHERMHQMDRFRDDVDR